MKLLSELLKRREELMALYNNSCDDEEYEMIGLALDCIECSLMYGDYTNDTGKEYNYWEE